MSNIDLPKTPRGIRLVKRNGLKRSDLLETHLWFIGKYKEDDFSWIRKYGAPREIGPKTIKDIKEWVVGKKDNPYEGLSTRGQYVYRNMLLWAGLSDKEILRRMNESPACILKYRGMGIKTFREIKTWLENKHAPTA